MKKNYQFLNDINFPSDLRKISENNLQKVADEVREEMIDAVSETGGHLGIAGGQYLDLSYERKKISRNKILEMEIKKIYSKNFLI